MIHDRCDMEILVHSIPFNPVLPGTQQASEDLQRAWLRLGDTLWSHYVSLGTLSLLFNSSGSFAQQGTCSSDVPAGLVAWLSWGTGISLWLRHYAMIWRAGDGVFPISQSWIRSEQKFSRLPSLIYFPTKNFNQPLVLVRQGEVCFFFAAWSFFRGMAAPSFPSLPTSVGKMTYIHTYYIFFLSIHQLASHKLLWLLIITGASASSARDVQPPLWPPSRREAEASATGRDEAQAGTLGIAASVQLRKNIEKPKLFEVIPPFVKGKGGCFPTEVELRICSCFFFRRCYQAKRATVQKWIFNIKNGFSVITEKLKQ